MTWQQVAALVVKRFAFAALAMVAVSFATFSLLYLAPGSAEQVLIGPRSATPELIATLRAQFHLDDPFLVQYWEYMKGVLHGDFGTSISSAQPVGDMVAQAAPVSLFLAVYAFVLTIVAGVTLGVFAALHHRTGFDRGVVGLSVVGVSAPAFASGFLLMYVFSVELGWFPSIGAGEGFSDRLSHLTLPAVALAISASALVVKLTRASVVTALEQDYVTFARARGLSHTRVILAYALRNALVPIIAAGGMVFTFLITGAVLVEVTFTVAGLGNMMIEAVNAKDVPVVQAVVLIFSFVIVMVSLVVDLAYLAVDPRIRTQGRIA